MKCYVIGRSRHADIVLADESVAARHAELVVTADGRHHVTNCRSDRGTAMRIGSEWHDIRQAYIDPSETLRLGTLEITVAALLSLADRRGAGPGKWTENAGDESEGRRDNRPSGRVERDPETGEIIRRSP